VAEYGERETQSENRETQFGDNAAESGAVEQNLGDKKAESENTVKEHDRDIKLQGVGGIVEHNLGIT
jgi:hypothetical protein